MRSLNSNSRNTLPLWGKPLPLDFYKRETALVAKELLGKGLLIKNSIQLTLSEIVETEAYLSEGDPASHSARGKTQRNSPMFESGGICYVYRCYGLHFCMNVVTGERGVGEAVLLRALAPLSGFQIMEKRRKTRDPRNLLSGPAKITQALGVDLSYNGVVFNREDFAIVELKERLPFRIGTSPRIGISKAKTKPLRFFVKESPWVSK